MPKKMNNERFEYLIYRQDQYSRAKKSAEKKGTKCLVKPLTRTEKKEMQDHLREVIKRYHPRS